MKFLTWLLEFLARPFRKQPAQRIGDDDDDTTTGGRP
jgi:hypothetical protein